MAAIGWGPGKLFRLVMIESVWLALVGLALAALLTIGPYRYLARNGIDVSRMVGSGSTEIAGVAMSSILKVGIFPENVALIALAALFATLLSGLYPAWRAGRVDPVETIRLV
jgi:ABC-type lipoprotein release transport system permease subunit